MTKNKGSKIAARIMHDYNKKRQWEEKQKRLQKSKERKEK